MEDDWNIAMDLKCPTQGMNRRIRMAKQAGLVPTKLLLDKRVTAALMRERGWLHLPRSPRIYGSPPCEVIFNAPGVVGIAYEGVPKPPLQSRRRSARLPHPLPQA